MRQREHLARVRARYPDAWRQTEHFRALRGLELPLWPSWCYVPLAGAYAVVSGGGANRVAPADAHWVGIVGALAAWRLTQGIYRYDPDLLDAVVDTDLDRTLPDQALYRLPEWCVYLELPESYPWAGAYAHLEADTNTDRRELRLVLDDRATGQLHPVPIHLTGGTLADGLSAMAAEAKRQADSGLPGLVPTDLAAELSPRLAPLVSLVLYLCSDDAELLDPHHPDRRPRYAQGKRIKTGTRWFPADHPTVWETGFDLGHRLRAARAARAAPAAGTHATPRPHIRRAHWHSYWLGPRSAPEKRRLKLRWLPPIAVNVTDPTDLHPTIHHVPPK